MYDRDEATPQRGHLGGSPHGRCLYFLDRQGRTHPMGARGNTAGRPGISADSGRVPSIGGGLLWKPRLCAVLVGLRDVRARTAPRPVYGKSVPFRDGPGLSKEHPHSGRGDWWYGISPRFWGR